MRVRAPPSRAILDTSHKEALLTRLSHACALQRNLLRRTVLAVYETHPEDEGEARRCEETGSESRDIHSACADEA